MTDTQAEAAKKQRQRSPNYPAISLPEAIERASKLYAADGRNGSPLEAAVRHFGFNRPHGTAMALVSALRKYGLVEASNNRITLTPRAIAILVYPDGDPRKLSAIREAALAPEIYAELYSRFLPAGKFISEVTLKAELEADMKFNPKAISAFVRDLKDTLIYAGLLAEDGVTLRSGGDSETSVPAKQALKIGDYVQWEPKGVLQFPEPKCIRSFSDDGQFAFVDGSDTGLSVSELTLQAKPEKPAIIPNVLSKNATMREDVFSLTEGQVRIQWPTPLSAESIQDLKDWLEIVERKITRSTAPAQESSDRDESR